MDKAPIFDIQRGSYVDGPGIRTTVFSKGCNLRCKWCHNPESQLTDPQILFYRERCTGCGKCREVCPHKGTDCTLCGTCALLCPHDARELCGEWYTPEAILKEVIKDRVFYDNTGGGVTFSGGECMLHIEFLKKALKLCKENSIHTAVDTAGCVPWDYFASILPYTDLFLYDIKCLSEELHRQGTGADNRLILANLQKLSDETDVHIIIRIPVIPGFNDTDEEMQSMSEFLSTIRHDSVELLPYHRLGEHKYQALGRTAVEYAIPSTEDMQRFRKIIEAADC